MVFAAGRDVLELLAPVAARERRAARARRADKPHCVTWLVGHGQGVTLHLVDQLQPLRRVHDLRLAVEHVVELGVGVARVGDARNVFAQQGVELSGGVIGEVGDILHHHIELAPFHRRVPKLGLDG